MNAEKKNGDYAAFASDDQKGLTKREWFAGMIIQGLIAAQPPGGSGKVNAVDQTGKAGELSLCVAAVCLADTMLYELSK